MAIQPAEATMVELDQIITADGVIWDLTDGAHRWLLGHEGYGLPETRAITQRGPQQHGESIVDWRLEPRIIRLELRERSCSRDEYWAIRAELVDHLRPNRSTDGSVQLARLRKVLPDGDMRDIEVLQVQGPRFRMRSRDRWEEWSYQEPIVLRAPDPTWFDPDQVSVEFALVGFDELVFDIEFPIVFGSGILNQTVVVAYLGTWPTLAENYGLRILITGPLEQPVVTNLSIGEAISLSGYDIPVGQQVEIDLAYGRKTVTNLTTGANLLGSVSEDSDLATFRLECDPRVAGGLNEINVFGAGAVVGQTAVALDYYTRWIGI